MRTTLFFFVLPNWDRSNRRPLIKNFSLIFLIQLLGQLRQYLPSSRKQIKFICPSSNSLECAYLMQPPGNTTFYFLTTFVNALNSAFTLSTFFITPLALLGSRSSFISSATPCKFHFLTACYLVATFVFFFFYFIIIIAA